MNAEGIQYKFTNTCTKEHKRSPYGTWPVQTVEMALFKQKQESLLRQIKPPEQSKIAQDNSKNNYC